MPKTTSYYKRLRISRDASQEDIRQAYRKVLLEVHPDVNSEPGATELFLDIQEAYSVLSDPVARASHDEKSPPEAPPIVQAHPLYSATALRHLDEPQLIYSLIDIVPTDQSRQSQIELPLHLVLVLDLSTSMKGTRLNTLKAATLDIIQELEAEDFISIVTFNDKAEVLFRTHNHLEKTQIESKMMGLMARGGTEIYRGLEVGFNEINHRPIPGSVCHIILITDGHTYGDEKMCLELAKQASKLDIGISGFGIGNEWNDKFLDDIAALTGGQSIYIQNPKQVKQFLRQKVHRLTKAYAKNVILNLNLAPKVTLKSAFRLLPEVSPLPTSSPFSLGPIRHQSPQRILLEFLVDTIPSTIDNVGLASGEFIIKLQGEEQQVPLTLKRSVVSSKANLDLPPEVILAAMSQLTMYKMQEKAQQELAQGNHQAAQQRMKYLATSLLAKEELSLGKAVLKEATHIKEHHDFSADGQKQIKYGTRKLLLPINQFTEQAP